jgi:hypothetical protein
MPLPTLTYRANVENGSIQMQDSIRRKMVKEVGYSYEGHNITFTIKKRRNTRSGSQNAYYWSVVLPLILDAMIDLGNELQSGNPDHLDMIHDLMKRDHLDNGLEVRDADGTLYKLPSSTKNCSTLDFMEYIQRIQMWAAEMLNIDIPDPNEQRELQL